MGKNKKKTFLYVIGFLTHFLFLCYLHPLTLQAQTKKEEIDITALSKQIEKKSTLIFLLSLKKFFLCSLQKSFSKSEDGL